MISDAGHNPKREESGGHMVAVLVVLLVTSSDKNTGAGRLTCAGWFTGFWKPSEYHRKG